MGLLGHFPKIPKYLDFLWDYENRWSQNGRTVLQLGLKG